MKWISLLTVILSTTLLQASDRSERSDAYTTDFELNQSHTLTI
jgi:hypothetical protein